MKHAKLIQDTSQGPNITTVVVTFIVPDFRTCVIRSSSLSHCELSIHDLRYVQVAQFSNSIHEKDVGWLDVSMDDFVWMEHFQASQLIIGDLPDEVLVEFMILSCFLLCQALKVSSICVLHDYTKNVILLLEKGALVLDDVWGVNWCQQTNFIESVIFFFGTEFVHLHLFDGELLLGAFIFFNDFDHSAKTTTAQLLDDLKFVHWFLFIEEKLFRRYKYNKFNRKNWNLQKHHTWTRNSVEIYLLEPLSCLYYFWRKKWNYWMELKMMKINKHGINKSI